MGVPQPRPADPTAVRKRLAIYLNDHHAGATAGVALARRTAREHADTADGPELERLATEIAMDLHALRRVMSDSDIRIRRYKWYAAWTAERIGRLKPNGRVLRRAELSTVVELEALLLGVEAKATAWQTLSRIAEHDSRLDRTRLTELYERARRQADSFRALHAAATPDAFTA
ncbi:MAG: hypothetical protein QOF98_1115 [Streptomyces sp.]|nr:hypothetical protein [Streptomyces sp.]